MSCCRLQDRMREFSRAIYVYAMIIKYDNKNKANETEDFQCFVRIEFFDFDL